LGRNVSAGRRIGVSAWGRDVSCSEGVFIRKNVMSSVKHFRELAVYQGAMLLVMRIFELTRHFPVEERYTLTDQVRRSSRSVCANLAEAWRKRRYQAAFVSKLNDAETEAAETQVHTEIAFRHGYLSQEIFNEIDDACDKILAQIVKMIDQADRWVIKPRGPSQVSDHLIREQEADSPLREYADTPTRRYADPSPPGGASDA
jgi:four helix bundle protein